MRRRVAWRALGAAVFLGAFWLPASCGGPQEQAGLGGECYRADDCQTGLVCINGVCSNDLTGIVSTVDGPAGDAPPAEAGPDGSGGAAGAGGAPTGGGGAPTGGGGAPSGGGTTGGGGSPSGGGTTGGGGSPSGGAAGASGDGG
ncbi:MAG: hypothetical protein HS104_13010 [Polyangiaceae bacterium]|nr:hypothetical protein [Polyangiaceae bacterium]